MLLYVIRIQDGIGIAVQEEIQVVHIWNDSSSNAGQ